MGILWKVFEGRHSRDDRQSPGPVRGRWKIAPGIWGKLVSYHLLMNGDVDFFIVSDIPDEKMAEMNLINAMLVRAAGGIESLTTVPARTAEDAVEQMRKAQKMAADMVYQAPSQT